MPDMDLAALQRFAVPGIAIAAGNGGFPRLTIANDQAQAELYLHGAHLTGWQPRGERPVLWMSASSRFTAYQPIRGGVPLCWPWFGLRTGARNMPGHGFARLLDWTLATVAQLPDGRTRVELSLSDDDYTRALWPSFALSYAVTVGRTLEMELTVRNPGREAFSCEEALHTYLAVEDVRAVRIRGLEATPFTDTCRGDERRVQQEAILTIAAETDRSYQQTTAAVVVEDPGALPGSARRIQIAKRGSTSTVVWNPWIAKAMAMADFGDDEWPGMLCVETANIGEAAVVVQPGGEQRIGATISLLK